MPRVRVVVCLIASVLTAGCASGPRPAAGPDASPGPAAADSAAAGRPPTELPTGGPRPRWVQPDWWDDHPVARAAAWTGLGVAVGAVVTVVVLAVIVAAASKQVT